MNEENGQISKDLERSRKLREKCAALRAQFAVRSAEIEREAAQEEVFLGEVLQSFKEAFAEDLQTQAAEIDAGLQELESEEREDDRRWEEAGMDEPK